MKLLLHSKTATVRPFKITISYFTQHITVGVSFLSVIEIKLIHVSITVTVPILIAKYNTEKIMYPTIMCRTASNCLERHDSLSFWFSRGQYSYEVGHEKCRGWEPAKHVIIPCTTVIWIIYSYSPGKITTDCGLIYISEQITMNYQP